MPIQIIDDIRPEHLPLVWNTLKRKFGFDSERWQEAFEKEFILKPRGTERVEFFLSFGVQTINPVLNRILHRPWDYPTFLRLVEFIVYQRPTFKHTPTLPQLSKRASSGYS